MEAALGGLVGVRSWKSQPAARQDFNRWGWSLLPAPVDAEAGESETSVSALVFSEFSSSLGFRRLCAKPKAERGLVEHLASMHGAQEFISSPENKEEREMGGGDPRQSPG